MNTTTKAIVYNYSRIYWTLDPQDLRQEAALATLEAAKTWREGAGANLDTYTNRAIAFCLRRFCHKALSPVSASARYVHELRGIEKLDLTYDKRSVTPDHERAMDYARAAHAIDALLARQPLAREVLLEEVKPADVAKRYQVPVQKVYRSLVAARAAIAKCETLQELAE